MKQLFNMDYVNALQEGNYFGCEMNGQTEEQQEAIQQAWIDAMARRGWILNEDVIECLHDHQEFTSDADSCLFEAHNQVLGGLA
jgi:hypothetical protein